MTQPPHQPPSDQSPHAPPPPQGAGSPQHPTPEYASSVPPALETNSEAKTFGMLCHLTALSGVIIPFGNIIGPLVFWLIKKDQHPFVDDQGKEALNFNITMLIAGIISAVLIIILIGFLLIVAVLIVWLVFTIIASIKASAGERYRYPLTIRMIS